MATIPAVYALGNRFLSRKVGLAAAALLAVHCFHVQYSQELRCYSLLALLLVLSTHAFLAALETPGAKSLWILYAALSVLAVYTQVFAVFVVASQLLVLTPSRIKRVGIATVLGTAAAIGLLVAPLAVVMARENSGQINWVPRLSVGGVTEVIQAVAGTTPADSQTAVHTLVLSTLYVTFWILAILGLYQTRRNQNTGSMTNVALSLLAFWLFFPIVTMLSISLLKPVFYPRYLLMCAPGGVLLAGQGLVTIERWSAHRGRFLASAGLVMMLACSLVGSFEYFASFKTYGHDWRGVTKYILSKQEPRDGVIFYNQSALHAFDYYVGRERKFGDVRSSPFALFPNDLDPVDVDTRSEPFRRIWLVLHVTIPTVATDRKTELIQEALRKGFQRVEEKEFPGTGMTSDETGTIRVELYSAVSREK